MKTEVGGKRPEMSGSARERIFLVKKLSPWMLDEFIALAELAPFSLVLLRTPEPHFLEKLAEVERRGAQVLVKPFSRQGAGRRLLSAVLFGLRHCFRLTGLFNAAIGLKTLYWFVRFDARILPETCRIQAHFATQAPLLAYLLCRGRLGRSFSFTVHAHDIFFRNRWLGLLAGAADKVLSISEFNLLYLRRHYGLEKANNLFLARLGVRPPTGPRNPREGEEPVIGFMSRLIPKKGLPDLLAAFRLAGAELPLRLLIAGAGPEAIRLEELRDERVSRLGRLSGPEKDEFYARLDMFVLPARPAGDDLDGIPVVLMEAAVRGLPLVSTRVSGIPEICIDGFNGLLVPPGDVAALAEALLKLGRDPELRRRLGENSRQVAGRYDLETNTRAKAELLGWLGAGNNA